MTRPSLFEFAGGGPAFLALAAAHHERCLADPILNHPFSHPGHPQHVERLASYWAEVFGGPQHFSHDCGGHSGMIAIHAGQEAHGDLGDRFVACFVQAAEDAGLPDDPDFRGALRSYMEWAVAEVMSYSPKGSHVPSALAMPRWSWDGLSPDGLSPDTPPHDTPPQDGLSHDTPPHDRLSHDTPPHDRLSHDTPPQDGLSGDGRSVE